MQQILSVDLSCTPARATLVECTGSAVRIVDSVEQSLEAPRSPAFKAEERPPSEADGLGEPHGTSAPNALSQLFGKVRGSWSEMVLLLPPEQYLSLNVDLPFGDSQSIAKVLDVEVQDLVPFTTDGFLVTHRAVGPVKGRGGHDIHVSVLPKNTLQAQLERFREQGQEPVVVTTPTSAAAAWIRQQPERFVGVNALILVRESYCGFIGIVDGVPRTDRIILRAFHRSAAGSTFLPVDELRASIRQFELRYELAVTRVVAIASPSDASALSQTLGVPVEPLNLDSFSPPCREEEVLSCGAALFAREDHPLPPLSNFRAREFRYNPILKNLAENARTLQPLALAALLLVFLVPLAVFGLRALRLADLEQKLHAAVVTAFPGVEVPAGNEVTFVAEQSGKMKRLVDDIGSSTQVSPLEALLAISKDFPTDSPVQVRKFRVRGNRVTLQVISPNSNYGALDRLERALEKRKDIYHRVSKKVADGGFGEAGSVTATFDIILKE